MLMPLILYTISVGSKRSAFSYCIDHFIKRYCIPGMILSLLFFITLRMSFYSWVFSAVLLLLTSHPFFTFIFIFSYSLFHLIVQPFCYFSFLYFFLVPEVSFAASKTLVVNIAHSTDFVSVAKFMNECLTFF